MISLFISKNADTRRSNTTGQTSRGPPSGFHALSSQCPLSRVFVYHHHPELDCQTSLAAARTLKRPPIAMNLAGSNLTAEELVTALVWRIQHESFGSSRVAGPEAKECM